MKIILEGREVLEYLAWRYGVSWPIKILFTIRDIITGDHLAELEAGMAYQLPVDKKVEITVTAVDQYGNPAVFAAKPAWALSDSSLAILTATADGLSAVVEPAGVLGVEKVTATAGTLAGSIDLQLIAGQPVALNLSVGQQQPK
jgi:hypothetical protein